MQTRTVEVPVAQFAPIPARLTSRVQVPPAPPPRCTDKGVAVLCGDQLAEWIEDGFLPLIEMVNGRFDGIACLSRQITDESAQRCAPPQE